MKENMQNNDNTNSSESVEFNIPLSDILYSRFRNEMIKTQKKREFLFDEELPVSGVLMIADKTKPRTYLYNTVSFGSEEGIINSLAFALINKLNKVSSNYPIESKEEFLRAFIKFFCDNATHELFGNKNDEDFELDLMS